MTADYNGWNDAPEEEREAEEAEAVSRGRPAADGFGDAGCCPAIEDSSHHMSFGGLYE